MPTYPNDPAFPVHNHEAAPGLTKLEELAKAAMQGLLANGNVGQNQGAKSIAELAVDEAEALIAVLNDRAAKPDQVKS